MRPCPAGSPRPTAATPERSPSSTTSTAIRSISAAKHGCTARSSGSRSPFETADAAFPGATIRLLLRSAPHRSLRRRRVHRRRSRHPAVPVPAHEPPPPRLAHHTRRHRLEFVLHRPGEPPIALPTRLARRYAFGDLQPPPRRFCPPPDPRPGNEIVRPGAAASRVEQRGERGGGSGRRHGGGDRRTPRPVGQDEPGGRRRRPIRP